MPSPRRPSREDPAAVACGWRRPNSANAMTCVLARPALLKRTGEPEREESHERSSPSEVFAVLAVERAGVSVSVRRRRVGPLAVCAAAALAGPRHRGPIAFKAEAVADQTAAKHRAP